jgi:hypothetical protein
MRVPRCDGDRSSGGDDAGSRCDVVARGSGRRAQFTVVDAGREVAHDRVNALYGSMSRRLFDVVVWWCVGDDVAVWCGGLTLQR